MVALKIGYDPEFNQSAASVLGWIMIAVWAGFALWIVYKMLAKR